MPRSGRTGERLGLDLPGAAPPGVGLFGLLHPLVTGAEHAWTPLVAEVCGAAVLLGVFVAWQHRVARAGRAPLLPPRFFAQRRFSLGVPGALLFHGGDGAFVFLPAFHLQRRLSLALWQAAVEFVPTAVCTSGRRRGAAGWSPAGAGGSYPAAPW